MTRLEEIALELLETTELRAGTYACEKKLIEELKQIREEMRETARKGKEYGNSGVDNR